MTRKKFIKNLMGIGYSRNYSNYIAKKVTEVGSYNELWEIYSSPSRKVAFEFRNLGKFIEREVCRTLDHLANATEEFKQECE